MGYLTKKVNLRRLQNSRHRLITEYSFRYFFGKYWISNMYQIIWSYDVFVVKVHIHILRRPQNFEKIFHLTLTRHDFNKKSEIRRLFFENFVAFSQYKNSNRLYFFSNFQSSWFEARKFTAWWEEQHQSGGFWYGQLAAWSFNVRDELWLAALCVSRSDSGKSKPSRKVETVNKAFLFWY